jgi:hypothetical protein
MTNHTDIKNQIYEFTYDGTNYILTNISNGLLSVNTTGVSYRYPILANYDSSSINEGSPLFHDKTRYDANIYI